MEKAIEGLIVGIVAIVFIGIVAVIGGTVVYLMWPYAIPAVFPGLVAGGTIAGHLTWAQSIALTWICGVLIRCTNSKSNN
jgi:hypothetical protein